MTRASENFTVDWEMKNLVEAAQKRFGILASSRCFCLKIPGPLGGRYDLENIGTILIEDLIKVSGDIAHQIKGSPDGTKIAFQFVD